MLPDYDELKSRRGDLEVDVGFRVDLVNEIVNTKYTSTYGELALSITSPKQNYSHKYKQDIPPHWSTEDK